MSTYIVNLDHDSSMFNYYPYGDPYSTPDLKAGWAPVNDITGPYDPLSNITDLSEGASSHMTQQDGAILELYFRGSSLTLFGEVDGDCPLNIWLDGASSAGMPGNGRIADLSALNYEDHRMVMTVHPSANGSISFRGATIEVTPWNEGAHIGYTGVNISYGQQWTQVSDEILGSFHQTAAVGASINMTLHETSAIVVYGIRGPNYGRFNVTLDNTTSTYLAKSSFRSHSVLFAATDLDSSIDHHITLTSIQDDFAISSINITTTTGGHPPSPDSDQKVSIPRGTLIAVATVGIGILVVLIITVAYVLLRRRMRERNRIRRQLAMRPPSGPSFMYDQAGTKSYNGTDPVVVLSESRHSYADSEDSLEDEIDDDGAWQFVRRPLLGSTPSLRLPNFGPDFHLDFSKQPSDHSDHLSRKASRRLSRAEADQGHDHPQNQASDQTDFLHLQDTSHSTDHSKQSSEGERHRGRVRFSTPALHQLFKQPIIRLGRRSYSRSSKNTEPNSPGFSEFTFGTDVEFAHPDSTPSQSAEDHAHDASASHAPDLSRSQTGTDHNGFIPLSHRPRSSE